MCDYGDSILSRDDTVDIESELGFLWKIDVEASIAILLYRLNIDKDYELISLYIHGEKRLGVVVCSDDDRCGNPNFRTNVFITVDGELFAYPCRYNEYNCQELDLEELVLGDEREIELFQKIRLGLQDMAG